MTDQDGSTIRTCSKCEQQKTEDEFSRDKNRATGRFPYCKECMKVRSKKYYRANPEKSKDDRTRHYQDNKQRYIANAKKWSEENREKRGEISKQYVKRNPEKRSETSRNNRLQNPGMYAAHFKARQQRKRKAMPAWANEAAIKAIYDECARVSKETGALHHVDHFYPLKNDNVCGLHNEYNLRIISAFDNLSKGNSIPTEDLWQLKK